METQNFVAVDFETMTPELTSACSVGLVKVINGVIAQKYYTLIKPIPDGRTQRNTFIHHITDEMVANAPTFKDIFPFMLEFIDGLTLVCHNKSTDMNVFYRCMKYYGLTGLDLYNHIDTLEIYGKSLDKCCAENGIELTCHHDALADAEACAKLLLCHFGQISQDMAHYELKEVIADRENRSYEHDTLMPLMPLEVQNTNTPFFQRKVVITGVLDAYPVRNELGAILKNFGADVDTSISKRTNVVIVGHKAGPAKLKKIQELNAAGCHIRVIYEPELCEIMKDINPK